MSSNDNPFQYYEYESEPFNERQGQDRASGPHSPHFYVDSSVITSVVFFLLIVAILVDALGTFVSSWEAIVLQNIQSGAYETDEAIQTAAESSDLRVSLVGVLQLVISIPLGIVFLCWTWRVCKNAHALGMTPMTNTPGWAVGWYFIPIFNLWKPYMALREAFLASCFPDGEQQSGTSIFPAWWCFHIVSAILGQISGRMAFSLGDSPEMAQLLTLNGIQITEGVVDILLNALTLVIVLRFLRCQRETREKTFADFL